MRVRANDRNLRKYTRELLGKDYSIEHARQLRKEVLTGYVHERYCHVSFSRQAHLERIGKIIGTYGVEGILLDRKGQDRSGDCSMQNVKWDIQYCNAGDPYVLTVMYVNGRLMIGDWGSIAESCD